MEIVHCVDAMRCEDEGLECRIWVYVVFQWRDEEYRLTGNSQREYVGVDAEMSSNYDQVGGFEDVELVILRGKEVCV